MKKYPLSALSAGFVLSLCVGLGNQPLALAQTAPAQAETGKNTAAPLAVSVAQNNLSAKAFVMKLSEDAAHKVVSSTATSAEIDAYFSSFLQERFDLDAIGRFAVGRFFNAGTEAQRQEFSRLFLQQLVQSYRQRFLNYSNEKFMVLSEQQVSDKDTLVESQFLQQDGPPINIEWRVRRTTEGTYRVVDISVEGISMARTYRADYEAALQRIGFDLDAFLKQMAQTSL
ncbi:MAG: MlaC/ttg2D family ABC transporter substrate-binding protein [Alphaproteobacteria bacterium]